MKFCHFCPPRKNIFGYAWKNPLLTPLWKKSFRRPCTAYEGHVKIQYLIEILRTKFRILKLVLTYPTRTRSFTRNVINRALCKPCSTWTTEAKVVNAAHSCEAGTKNIQSCFYINGHGHISELINASDGPKVCVAQVEVQFVAPSEKCLVMYVTWQKAIILQYSVLLVSSP